MSKVKLYIARHGKTMFNTIGRAQGWSDSPLTPFGEEGIRELGVGLKATGISFKAAYSSDSGRTIQTMDIILRETGLETIPYKRDKRIREWCFGSLDGGYDGELFYGVLPRTDAFQGKELHEVTYPELAQGILDVDTAGWAESWEVLRKRIIEGFTAIAEDLERSGGGNAIVVSHGMTIATFAWLIDPSVEVKNNYPSRRQAKKQTNWFLVISSVLIAVLLVVAGLYSVFGVSRTVQQTNGSSVTKSSKQATDATQSKDAKGLPDVSPKDWQLLLVNRDNKSKELNPELANVDGVSVDARIAKNVKQFLAAAQEIDPSYHLISGYRSVAYQTELYNSYVQQEMAADPTLTESQAEKKVQTYSQPPGASEHQTGLAIDMSTVDSLNEADPDTVAKVKKLAPKYGFVLRFLDGKTSSTGVGYEDWHFRYVGKESAEYMTEHNITLEEYLALLKEKTK